MGLLAIQAFSQELEPVVQAVNKIGSPRTVETAAMEAGGPRFIRSLEDLPTLLSRLSVGRLGAVCLREGDPGFRQAVISAPEAFGSDVKAWTVTIDLETQDWRPLWLKLLGVSGLSVVYIAIDDALDIRNSDLTSESFPWGESRLIVA